MNYYKEHIGKIENFPIDGITYRDIQPLLAKHTVFMDAIKDMGNLIETKPDYWIALESRGFLFASALSMLFGGGVRLIRKKGKKKEVIKQNSIISTTKKRFNNPLHIGDALSQIYLKDKSFQKTSSK